MLLFYCVGFVETIKISAFVTSSVYAWEESPLVPRRGGAVLLLNKALFLKGALSCYLI